ncbi:MAG: glycosyltransferase family A protein [Eubacteriales bacterium]|nr:glycosyltransferase family A protein [Eubacteriales bacterium]
MNREMQKAVHEEMHETAHEAVHKKEQAENCPLVSVIIPVYNRSKTIARCADSILAQTYQNLEIIFVNDGSSDDSFEQLLAYAKRDKRIVLINKPNSGVSDSRNYALESAHGTYIQFVDSDDWIPENATEEYVKAALASDSDLVVADYYRVRGKQVHQSGDIRAAGDYTRTEYAKLMMDRAGDFYYGVVWNKLFRRSLIEENALNFNEKLDWCEDFLFNLEYLKYAARITVIRKPLYFYVKTKGSLVSTKTTPANVILTKLTLYEYYKELYQSLDLYEDNKLRVQGFLLQAAADKKKLVDPETYDVLLEKYLREPGEGEDEDLRADADADAEKLRLAEFYPGMQELRTRLLDLNRRLQELSVAEEDGPDLIDLWNQQWKDWKNVRSTQREEQKRERREQRERRMEMLIQLLRQQTRQTASGKRKRIGKKADRGGLE